MVNREEKTEHVTRVNKKMRETESFEYYLIKKVGKTIKKYNLIEEGDRILVGVSGGKDSLTLLKLLYDQQGFYPNRYELMVLHVVSSLQCEGAADPKRLEEFLRDHGYPYRFVYMDIEPDRKGGSYWCSRNRRRLLFDTALKSGYNKLALGHHRNDVLETFMLNVFYHGEISSMLPLQELFGGKLSIIRPLYNIPEKDTRRFARLYGFPVSSCRCPVDREMKRELFKRLLHEVERENPRASVNALRSLERVNEKYLPGRLVREDMRM
jgi:tRNA 2-thiocytidine biosynthesis protein TtcA